MQDTWETSWSLLQDDLRGHSYLISDPALARGISTTLLERGSERGASASYASQCFTTAAVESMMVPSMSKSSPSKVTCTGGAE